VNQKEFLGVVNKRSKRSEEGGKKDVVFNWWDNDWFTCIYCYWCLLSRRENAKL